MRAKHIVAATIAVLAFVGLWQCTAEATCVMRRRGKDFYACCSPPGGPMRCHKVKPRKPRCMTRQCVQERQRLDRLRRERLRRERQRRDRLYRERMRRNRDRYRLYRRWNPPGRRSRSSRFSSSQPYWESLGMGKFTLEYTVGGMFTYHAMHRRVGDEVDTRWGLGGGGLLGIGFRYRKRYSKRSVVSESKGFLGAIVAIFTFGLGAIPYSIWGGTDRGLDLRFRALGVSGHGETRVSFALGLSPVFRVAKSRNRLRWPAIAHFFVPEIGVKLNLDQPHEFYIQPFRFPLGIMIDNFIAVEFEVGYWVTVPLEAKPVAGFALLAQMNIVLR